MGRDLNKLPRWVQEHITDLERHIAERDRQILQLQNERMKDIGTSHITWDVLMEGEYDIPDGATVRFYIDREHRDFIAVYFRKSENAVEINGSDTVFLEPRASNSLYLRMEDKIRKGTWQKLNR
jgi:hypothetical protein